MQYLKSRSAAVLAVLASFFVAGFASAQEVTFDTSAAVSQLSAVETGLVAVGGVIITLAAVAVGFKWIKGMIFG